MKKENKEEDKEEEKDEEPWNRKKPLGKNKDCDIGW